MGEICLCVCACVYTSATRNGSRETWSFMISCRQPAGQFSTGTGSRNMFCGSLVPIVTSISIISTGRSPDCVAFTFQANIHFAKTCNSISECTNIITAKIEFLGAPIVYSMCVLWRNHTGNSPCSFWFSLSILCSRICCRMAFLHSSLSSSLLLFVRSSGSALMEESPLPATPTWPMHTRPPSRQESPRSERHKGLHYIRVSQVTLHLRSTPAASKGCRYNNRDNNKMVNNSHTDS